MYTARTFTLYFLADSIHIYTCTENLFIHVYIYVYMIRKTINTENLFMHISVYIYICTTCFLGESM